MGCARGRKARVLLVGACSERANSERLLHAMVAEGEEPKLERELGSRGGGGRDRTADLRVMNPSL